MVTILVVEILSLFFLTSASSPAGAIKFGIIDLQKILELSDAGKSALMEINEKRKQMETDLQDKKAEIEAIEKQIKLESLAMCQENLEEKQRKKRIMIGDFKALRQKCLADYIALENRIAGRIQKEIVEIIQGIGIKSGYAMIIDKQAGGVVYSPLSMDITDSVIQVYNTNFHKSEFENNINNLTGDMQ
jgi:outer membrane protein